MGLTGSPTADIDHFKRINDSHGHPAGDAVLCEIARRMAGGHPDAALYLAKHEGRDRVVLAAG